MAFQPTDIKFVEIFPPIHIARVGDSDEYYIGPEIPGVEPVPVQGLKDQQHRIKKQAARFRVYAFDKNSNLLGEIVNNAEYTLTWSVHVANKKSAWVTFRGQNGPETWALRNSSVQQWPKGREHDYTWTDERTKLIVDSGVQTVTGSSAPVVELNGNFYGKKDTPTKVNLGDIRTDDSGRLVVCASNGRSFRVSDALPSESEDDWVDSICDGTVKVSVNSKTSGVTIPLRHKATIITAPPKLPSGVRASTTLYDLMESVYKRKKQSEPSYKADKTAQFKSYKSFDSIPLSEQPAALSRAALEWSNGAPLNSGIEAPWSLEFEEFYNMDTSEFRFADHVKSGDLTKWLSLPWQSNTDCNTHWWPSAQAALRFVDHAKTVELTQPQEASSTCNTHWWPVVEAVSKYMNPVKTVDVPEQSDANCNTHWWPAAQAESQPAESIKTAEPTKSLSGSQEFDGDCNTHWWPAIEAGSHLVDQVNTAEPTEPLPEFQVFDGDCNTHWWPVAQAEPIDQVKATEPTEPVSQPWEFDGKCEDTWWPVVAQTNDDANVGITQMTQKFGAITVQ